MEMTDMDLETMRRIDLLKKKVRRYFMERTADAKQVELMVDEAFRE
jgi:hypothetical protein